MQKIILVMSVLLLITLTDISVRAQNKKESEKPQTTTVDSWRTALPTTEQPQNVPNSDVEELNSAETVETSADIQKKVLDLEGKMMEALKGRDSLTLKSLLADDFILAGINITGTKSDKTRYIDWAVKNLEIKAYNLDKTTVRAYPSTAIVTYNYKRQANIAGVSSDGDFVVTDVWVKRGAQWLAVSHHISPAPKP